MRAAEKIPRGAPVTVSGECAHVLSVHARSTGCVGLATREIPRGGTICPGDIATPTGYYDPATGESVPWGRPVELEGRLIDFV
jgi:hypothetical protein